MSSFWKILSRLDVRLLLLITLAGLAAVLAWRIHFELDLKRQQEQEILVAPIPEPPRTASELVVLPVPDAGRNPFASSYLTGLRITIRQEHEQEIALLKEQAEQRRLAEEAERREAEAKRRAEEEAARKAAEAARAADEQQAATGTGSTAESTENGGTESSGQTAPRKVTLIYKGLLVRTDGVRLALIGHNGKDRYYPEGSTLEWITLEAFSRDSLTVRIGDQTVDLPREQPFTSQEP